MEKWIKPVRVRVVSWLFHNIKRYRNTDNERFLFPKYFFFIVDGQKSTEKVNQGFP